MHLFRFTAIGKQFTPETCMNKTLTFVLFGAVLLFVSDLLPTLSAQSFESLNKKASLYLESEEFAMAIPVITEIIHLQPDNAVAYKTRGLCYLRTGKPEKAIQDYLKAYEKDVSDTSLLLLIGNLFERVNNTVSAGVYYREYLKQRPTDPSGAYHLSLLLTAGGEYPDSAVHYARMACTHGPGDPANWYALGMAYFAAGDYPASITSAEKGLALSTDYYLLHKLLGLNYYFLGEWRSSLQSFAAAYAASNGDPKIAAYKANLLLICNTDPSYMVWEPGHFNLLLPAELPEEKKSKPYIDQLERFNHHLTELGTEDFFLLYLSYANEDLYKPTSLVRDSLLELYEEKYYEAFRKGAEVHLLSDPTDFPLYKALAEVYFASGDNEEGFTSLFKYYGFLSAIKASGNGTSPESAFIVTTTGHEREVSESLGYTLISQSLQLIDGVYFDRVEISHSGGEKGVLWFNTDLPFQWQLRANQVNVPVAKERKPVRIQKRR
jgi:tetratricopeptide (TPR) repeat protein